MISAGGTGGGMYPAFAVAEAMQADPVTWPELELLFVGSARSMDAALLEHSHVSWAHTALIQGGPVHGVNPLRLVSSAVRLTVGLGQAIRLVRRWRPASVFITGGWASLPVALAAWLHRVPVVTFVPDIEPALTLQVVGRFARTIAATTDETARYVAQPEKVVATGYPLRQHVLTATRERAVAHFGLDPARFTLLVMGGSSGSRNINRAVQPLVPELVAAGAQVMHLTGTLDWPAVAAARAQLAPEQQALYHAHAYLHDDMGLALAAADLVVSRAGASTLGEFTYFGLPAILAPYPYAWRYQRVNAEYLVSRGAARRIDDDELSAQLLPTVLHLLQDRAALQHMAAQARALAQPEGARRIAQVLTTGG